MQLLKFIAFNEKPTMKELMTAIDCSQPTVNRYLANLRSVYNMDIKYVRSKNNKAAHGYYQIYNWGIINKDTFNI